MPEHPCGEKLYTQEEIAEYFGVTFEAVRVWRRRGWLPYIRVGRVVRISESDLAYFIDAHGHQTRWGQAQVV